MMTKIKLTCGCESDGTYIDMCDLHRPAPDLAARVAELEEALLAFVEAYEKSLQLEKTDVAYGLAKQALETNDE
jgi:hypothetical protein